jgi:hypothetical protein
MFLVTVEDAVRGPSLWLPDESSYHRHDLFASLDVNKYHDMVDYVEQRLTRLLNNRHSYPMWPRDGMNPQDDWEKEEFQPLRHMYYQNTLMWIRLLRRLRDM